MILKRDSSNSGKWDIYKNGTVVVYGGSSKISIAKEHSRCLAYARQRSHAEVFKRKIGAGRNLS